jgi:hypothetical protein
LPVGVFLVSFFPSSLRVPGLPVGGGVLTSFLFSVVDDLSAAMRASLIQIFPVSRLMSFYSIMSSADNENFSTTILHIPGNSSPLSTNKVIDVF